MNCHENFIEVRMHMRKKASMKNVSVLLIQFIIYIAPKLFQLFRKSSNASVSRLSNETSSKDNSGRGFIVSTLGILPSVL